MLARCPGFIVRLTGSRSLLATGSWSGCRGEATAAASANAAFPATGQQQQQQQNSQPDKLYRMIELEVRGNDKAVLASYETFSTSTARELGITVHETWEKWRHIQKRSHLRSVFVNKKCQEQYEYRTYFRVMQFKYLTGSTADTFLEYIQRNLPEGVSMRVARHQLEVVPDHLKPPSAASETSEQN